eukprot:m.476398 g.476398  ORF g.476398 m.476398 type:complete len:266 (+) comp40807_c0_seq1:824-1621(+)
MERVVGSFYGSHVRTEYSNISGWDVSSVQLMFNMFPGASSFRVFITGWTAPTNDAASSMFRDATAWCAGYRNIVDVGECRNGPASNFVKIITDSPTESSTSSPTLTPSLSPSMSPTTSSPTESPTVSPTSIITGFSCRARRHCSPTLWCRNDSLCIVCILPGSGALCSPEASFTGVCPGKCGTVPPLHRFPDPRTFALPTASARSTSTATRLGVATVACRVYRVPAPTESVLSSVFRSLPNPSQPRPHVRQLRHRHMRRQVEPMC